MTAWARILGATTGRPRNRRLAVRRAGAVLAAGVLLVPGAGPLGAARAHPHAWIDLQTTAIVDEAGQVVALRQVWRFDAFYTLFVLEDFPPGGAGPDDAWIDALMVQNLENLADYDYFTEVLDAAGAVPFRGVEAVDGRLAGERLEMAFTLVFDRPADAMAGPVDYAVFDPSYYVEMRHRDGAGSVATQPADGCAVSLTRPDPEPEWLMMAAAADLGPATDSDLGRLFAERVVLTCGGQG